MEMLLKKESGTAKAFLGGISFVRYPLSKMAMALTRDHDPGW